MLQAETSRGTWTCTWPLWAIAFIHPCMMRNSTTFGLFNIPPLKLMFLLYESARRADGLPGKMVLIANVARVHVAFQAHQKRSFIFSSLQCPFMGSLQNTEEHQSDGLLLVYLWYERPLWVRADDAPVAATFHLAFVGCFILFLWISVRCRCENKDFLMLKSWFACLQNAQISTLTPLFTTFSFIGPNIPSCFEVAVKL